MQTGTKATPEFPNVILLCKEPGVCVSVRNGREVGGGPVSGSRRHASQPKVTHAAVLGSFIVLHSFQCGLVSEAGILYFARQQVGSGEALGGTPEGSTAAGCYSYWRSGRRAPLHLHTLRNASSNQKYASGPVTGVLEGVCTLLLRDVQLQPRELSTADWQLYLIMYLAPEHGSKTGAGAHDRSADAAREEDARANGRCDVGNVG